MNFWDEPEPWIISACTLLMIVVAIFVYPDPSWLINAAVGVFGIVVLTWIRIIHWWDFDE